MGTALLRLAYTMSLSGLRHHYSTLSRGLTVVCLAISTLATYLYIRSPVRNNSTVDVCLGRPHGMRSIIYDYVAGNAVPVIPYLVLVTGLVYKIAEFMVYVKICSHFCQQDMSMKKLIPKKNLRKRMKQNALDLFGHMLRFSVDLVLLLLNLVLGDRSKFKSDWAKLLSPMLSLSNYGVYGLLQTLISQPLRQQLGELVFGLFLIPQITKMVRLFNQLGCFQRVSVWLISLRIKIIPGRT